MVGSGRFELPACRLGGGCSIHLSYEPKVGKRSVFSTTSFPASYQGSLMCDPAYPESIKVFQKCSKKSASSAAVFQNPS